MNGSFFPSTSALPPPEARVAAARAALVSLADELAPLLEQELERLEHARRGWRSGGGAQALRIAAHDLKGLGALYGAPIAGRVAASLDRLLGGPGASPALVEAHVDSTLAMVRERAAAEGDPRGGELAQALEAAVDRVLAARLPQAA